MTKYVVSSAMQSFMAASFIYGLITSTVCLLYVIYKMKLNRFIKMILIISSGYNCLNYFLMLVASISNFLNNGETNVTTCRLWLYPFNETCVLWNMLAFISIIR